jgi:putative ABC transport system permease protein
MNISLKLAWRYIKNNKKRSIATVVGITLVTLLIVSLILLFNTYQSYMIGTIRSKSNWETKFNNIKYEDAILLEQNSDIQEVSLVQDLGIDTRNYSENEESQVHLHLKAYNLNAMKNLGIKVLEGRLPESNNEVVLSRNIALLYDYNEIDITINGETKNYKIVGMIDPPDFEEFSIIEDTYSGAITLLDESTLSNEDTVDASVIYKDITKVYKNSEELVKVLNLYDAEILYNTDLLHYSGIWNMNSEEDLQIIIPLILFIAIICIIDAIFLYSIFNITVLQRKKELANLNSIGASKKQIFSLILLETTIFLLIAVPLGIILSFIIMFAMITPIQNTLNIENLNIELNLSYYLIIAGILLICLISYLSVIIPALKASKNSIIDKIKENNVKFNKKALKVKTKTINGTLVYRNILKNKGKYIIMMLNVMFAVFMLVFSQGYIQNTYQNMNESLTNCSATIEPEDLDYIDEIRKEIKETDGVKTFTEYSFAQFWTYVEEEDINDSLKEALNASPELNDLLFYADTENEFNCDILALSGDDYHNYLKKVGLDKLENNECILINYDDVETRYYEGIYFTNYEEGDNIQLYLMPIKDKLLKRDENGKMQIVVEERKNQPKSTLRIARVTTLMPDNINVNKDKVVPKLRIIIGYDTLNKVNADFGSEVKSEINFHINSSNTDELDKKVEEFNLKYGTEISFTHSYGIDTEAEKSISEIFLFSISTLFIGITIINLVNVIVCDANLRTRDLFVLISLGMDNKKFNKMIIREYLIYLILPYILGTIIGLVAAYLLFQTTFHHEYFYFIIPYREIVIAFIAILLALLFIVKHINKKIKNNEVIENIKNENI